MTQNRRDVLLSSTSSLVFLIAYISLREYTGLSWYWCLLIILGWTVLNGFSDSMANRDARRRMR